VEASLSFGLSGRTAVVTGAGSGIGQAIAIAMAQAGADLVLIGHHRPMDETEEAVVEAGVRAATYYADLEDSVTAAALAREVLAGHSIDIVVNNAGTIRREAVLAYDMADWTAVLSTNLTSVFALAQTFAAPMVQRGHGKVINVASLLSFQGGVRVVAYTASKHGVVGLTRAMANELAPAGVQVNAIAPGYIATANTRALRDDPERSQAILERIPAGRWGRPEDIAGAAVFLASSASDYVTGQVLAVDGGWLAR